MGMKKRSKVNAEFNMSSLTDIIFLLLIFFMLTSSMVIPNALNLKLPGKSSGAPPSKEQPAKIVIESSGAYLLNGSKISLSGLEKRVRELKKGRKSLSVVITPDDKAPNQFVVAVMDIAYRYGVTAILTDPK